MTNTTDPYPCTCGCPDGEGQHLCGCEVYDMPRMRDLRDLVKQRRQELSDTIARVAPHDVISGEVFRAAVIFAEACAEATCEDTGNPDGGSVPIVE